MMLRPAPGAEPGASDVTLVNYVGYLAATGAVFDQGMRSPLPINGAIPGFAEGLQMMAKTGVARFCILAAMSYGSQGSGPIPANADLVFQVELVDYKPATDAEDMSRPQAIEPPLSSARRQS
jgi:FKBP-type peptidyl-prolyl cis-trans isomerase FkpA